MSNALASGIAVLSAGAVRPGLVKLVEAFRGEAGRDVDVAFATAPEMRQRLSGGETADVVIAPPDVLDVLVKAGKASAADCVTIGRVGVGVAIRDGAPLPRIATVEQFKQSLLHAESLVYNQASSGIYLARLFDRLGIGEQVRAKTTSYPDGAAVHDHVLKGRGREIGFGAITDIIDHEKMGLKLVGPLPAEIQNYTAYAAAVMAESAAPAGARSFVRYITSPAARATFRSTGIE